MPSTYSNLKIQLMATGENSTTWGTVTNTNFQYAVEEAITGSADVAFLDANVTLALYNTNTSQTVRNLRLNLTGSTATAGRTLFLGAGCIYPKSYIINNGTNVTITVQNSGSLLPGVAVPSGKTMWVFNTGTDVVDVVTYLSSLTLGTPLSMASGGTGASTFSAGYHLKGNGTSAISPGIIYDSGTAIGIGTATPGATLDVAGNILLSTVTPNVQFNAGGAMVYAPTGNTLSFATSGTPASPVEKFRIGNANQWGIAGANYGTAGQVFTSGGAAASATWSNVSVLDANATVNGVTVGYRSIPRSTTTTTAVVADVGKCIAASANIAIPTSTFAAGDALSIYNDSGSSISITSTLTNFRLAGTASTGTRTLAARGLATIWFNSPTEAIISGGGVS
jgi:hypothetical protein